MEKNQQNQNYFMPLSKARKQNIDQEQNVSGHLKSRQFSQEQNLNVQGRVQDQKVIIPSPRDSQQVRYLGDIIGQLNDFTMAQQNYYLPQIQLVQFQKQQGRSVTSIKYDQRNKSVQQECKQGGSPQLRNQNGFFQDSDSQLKKLVFQDLDLDQKQFEKKEKNQKAPKKVKQLNSQEINQVVGGQNINHYKKNFLQKLYKERIQGISKQQQQQQQQILSNQILLNDYKVQKSYNFGFFNQQNQKSFQSKQQQPEGIQLKSFFGKMKSLENVEAVAQQQNLKFNQKKNSLQQTNQNEYKSPFLRRKKNSQQDDENLNMVNINKLLENNLKNSNSNLSSTPENIRSSLENQNNISGKANQHSPEKKQSEIPRINMKDYFVRDKNNKQNFYNYLQPHLKTDYQFGFIVQNSQMDWKTRFEERQGKLKEKIKNLKKLKKYQNVSQSIHNQPSNSNQLFKQSSSYIINNSIQGGQYLSQSNQNPNSQYMFIIRNRDNPDEKDKEKYLWKNQEITNDNENQKEKIYLNQQNQNSTNKLENQNNLFQIKSKRKSMKDQFEYSNKIQQQQINGWEINSERNGLCERFLTLD